MVDEVDELYVCENIQLKNDVDIVLWWEVDEMLFVELELHLALIVLQPMDEVDELLQLDEQVELDYLDEDLLALHMPEVEDDEPDDMVAIDVIVVVDVVVDEQVVLEYVDMDDEDDDMG